MSAKSKSLSRSLRFGTPAERAAASAELRSMRGKRKRNRTAEPAASKPKGKSVKRKAGKASAAPQTATASITEIVTQKMGKVKWTKADYNAAKRTLGNQLASAEKKAIAQTIVSAYKAQRDARQANASVPKQVKQAAFNLACGTSEKRKRAGQIMVAQKSAKRAGLV